MILADESSLDSDKPVVLNLHELIQIVFSSDVDLAVCEAELEDRGVVEVFPDCEDLEEEGSFEAGTDMDDGIFRQSFLLHIFNI